MTVHVEDEETKTNLIMTALAGAMEERPDMRDPAVNALFDYRDTTLMYGACLAWARSMNSIIGVQPGEFTAIFSINTETGEIGGLDDVPLPEYGKAGIRFITAVANDDTDTADALFRASLEGGPEAATGLVAAVLFLTGSLLRATKSEWKRGGRRG